VPSAVATNEFMMRFCPVALAAAPDAIEMEVTKNSPTEPTPALI